MRVATLFCLLAVFSTGATAQTVINVPGDPVPSSIVGDTTLNVLSGGSVPGSFRVTQGATLNLHSGGSVGSYLDVQGESMLNVFGGSLGVGVGVRAGTITNIYGGQIGNSFQALQDSIVNVDDGVIGDHFRADFGSTINIAGGVFGRWFRAYDDSVVTIDNARFGDTFYAESGSTININGGQLGSSFQARGDAVVNLNGGSIGAFSDIYDSVVMNVNGGSISHGGGSVPGLGLHAHPGTTLNLTAGYISVLDIEENVTVNMSGGRLAGEYTSPTFARIYVPNASEFNLSGGNLNNTIIVHNGGTLDMTGGSVLRGVQVTAGGVARVRGGALGPGTSTSGDGQLQLEGYDFRINGEPVEGLGQLGDTIAIEVPYGSQLSGVLSDGSAFALSSTLGDSLGATLTASLHRTIEPTLPATVVVDNDRDDLYGIGGGRSLQLADGGLIRRNFTAGFGSTVVIEGGELGADSEFDAAQVTMTGGVLGNNVRLLKGSNFNMSGGLVDGSLFVRAGASLQISGGRVEATDHSSSQQLNIQNGAEAQISGGVIQNLWISPQASVEFVGSEFRLNGLEVDGLELEGNTTPVNSPAGGLLTGVLADGTAFAYNFDTTLDGAIQLRRDSADPPVPGLIELPSAPAPNSLRAGQQLLVSTGGAMPDNFTALHGSEVTLDGGELGPNFKAVGASVLLRSGSVASEFSVFDGSQVQIEGANIEAVSIAGGSTLTLSNGSIDGRLVVQSGARVVVDGGSMTSGILDAARSTAEMGGTIEVRSGHVGNGLLAAEGGTVIISGGIVGRGVRTNPSALSSWVGSQVFMSGGRITVNPVFIGGEFTMTGGTIDKGLTIAPLGDFEMNGGQISDLVLSGKAIISGGEVTGLTKLNAAGVLDVVGVSFHLDGVPIEGIHELGESWVVDQRGGELLSIVLRDGTLWELNLNATYTSGNDAFSPDATLRLTLSSLYGDYNFDGQVNLADYTVWRDSLGTPGTGLAADGNGDSVVDALDYAMWKEHFGQGSASPESFSSTAVPEPCSVLLFTAFLATAMVRFRCNQHLESSN